MTPENICVSLKLAKLLKDNGYNQEGSNFYWVVGYEPKIVLALSNGFSDFYGRQYEVDDFEEIYAAPTASEIGEKLDKSKIRFTSGPTVGFESPNDKYNIYASEVFDVDKGLKMIDHSEHGDTEANSRAKMWLYLKKNNLLPKETA